MEAVENLSELRKGWKRGVGKQGRDRPGPGERVVSGQGHQGRPFPVVLPPRVPGGPLAPPRRDRSLPTPHSPDRVSVRTRVPRSNMKGVRGPMTRILWVWEEAESGRVGGDFITAIR